jgi:hypothetical protein
VFRNAITIVSLILLSIAVVAAQQVIENPDKPQSKTAGRVIELKEVLKITDEGGEFYFKYPRNLKVGPDGSIFVQDNEQVLRFDKDGRFIRNYFKKGQGPGEMTYVGVLVPREKSLCIQAIGPSKLVWFDDAGKVLKEPALRPKGRMSLNLLVMMKDVYYFSGSEFPRVTGEPQYVDNPNWIMAWTEGSDEPKSLSAFPVKSYIITSGSGGAGMFTVGPFIAVPYQSRYLVIVHTSEYLLKVFDVELNAVVRTVSRKYDRIDTPPAKPEEKVGTVMLNNKTYAAPRQKYLNDISKVFTRNNEIWAATSTKDPKKGTLIDVFNTAGAYLDNFYLNVPAGVQYFIYGDFCYTVEKNPDETYAVKKYEILWKD